MNEARASLHLMSADLYATYVKAREVLGYVWLAEKKSKEKTVRIYLRFCACFCGPPSGKKWLNRERWLRSFLETSAKGWVPAPGNPAFCTVRASRKDAPGITRFHSFLVWAWSGYQVMPQVMSYMEVSYKTSFNLYGSIWRFPKMGTDRLHFGASPMSWPGETRWDEGKNGTLLRWLLNEALTDTMSYTIYTMNLRVPLVPWPFVASR
jgi:hypothetical protein